MMNSKAWKMSASIIIALRSQFLRHSLRSEKMSAPLDKDSKTRPNRAPEILCLRRGDRDKLLPGTHVFPGGHLEEADTSLSWIDLYRSFGYEENSFTSISTGGGIEHLPEYAVKTNASVPGWMSLRLCAIRETFEESGILLCRSAVSVQQVLPYASFIILKDLKAWQNRVKEDAKQMLALCQAVGCVPDLWGLHLWSNWLTPTQQRVRHNSVFFLAVLKSLPPYSFDKFEMDDLKCCSASDLMDLAHCGTIRLANPQFYETSRLTKFLNSDSLASFACHRAKLGCIRTMPVQEKTNNGMLFILPGKN